MIAYVKGRLETVGEDYIIVDQGGIGYEIKVPASLFGMLPQIGEEVKIHTYLYVREDAMVLYGFWTEDDLFVFKLLLTVSGIGPKGALAILSAVTPNELRFAVVTNDDKTIAKAPGIGKKTAQKLILDLKDKLKVKDFAKATEMEISQANIPVQMDIASEAIAALAALGYSQSEATKVVYSIKGCETVEELLKASLKALAKI